jgi:hypothetical protein
VLPDAARVRRAVARVLRDVARLLLAVLRLRVAAARAPDRVPVLARLLPAALPGAARPLALLRAGLADRRLDAARAVVCEGIDLPPL